MLTTAQLATLKTAILADPVLNAFPNNTDGNPEIAKAFNLPAAPAFTVWRTNISNTEIGNSFVGTELAGMTTGNQTRLQVIAQYSAEGVDPSRPDRRAFYDDVFSGAGGANTRAKLLIAWKRLATRAEKLFATGTGSDAAPATMTFEGALSYVDVYNARIS